MTEMMEKVNIENAGALDAAARTALRDTILTMADCKRLLGIRYSDWMLGAPTLESGIAASSMAQDEWGHGRLTYSLLSDFGDDPKALEHERSGPEYRGFDSLDRPLGSWSELVAADLVLDTALSVQYSAFLESRYQPIRNRVQKLLDEESFHFRYATSWTARLADTAAVRTEFEDALRRLLPEGLRWLGRENDPGTRALLSADLMSDGPDRLRAHLLGRLAPTLERAGLLDAASLERSGDEYRFTGELDWSDWNPSTRRTAHGEGMDAETLERVRGDRNRAFLVD